MLGRHSDELYQEMKRLAALSPEASQLNNSTLRERYAFLDLFAGMTAGQQQQDPPSFGALVTTHMHIWERWFQSCVPFGTCTINHSSLEAQFWRPFVDALPGVHYNDPFLVVPHAVAKKAAEDPRFETVNPILNLWFNWIRAWKLDVVVLQPSNYIPNDAGFKSVENLDYTPLYSTCRYAALNALVSRYDVLVTHVFLETSKTQLKILLPAEPSVGQPEMYHTMRHTLAATATCPVPVLSYMPWEAQRLTFPYTLTWWQYNVAQYEAMRPQHPRRDSLFVSSSRGMWEVLGDRKHSFWADSALRASKSCTTEVLQNGQLAELAACASMIIRKKLMSIGLGHLRVLIGVQRTVAEHLHEIANAWMVISIDAATSAGQVVAESILLGTPVYGSHNYLSHN